MSSQEEFEEKIEQAKQAYLDATSDWDRQTQEGNIKREIYFSYIWQLNNNDSETQLIAIKMACNETKEFVAMVSEIYNAFEGGKPA
jgi:hypothetical protein